MYFERFFEKGLAQASYLVGCQQSGEAMVVDPLRDVDRYLLAAKREGLRIAYVCETHVHADFVSGARQLADETGAVLALSEEGGADWLPQFPHAPLRDGDLIELGGVSVRVLHTPGHTPEHLSFLVTDTAAGELPLMILTGDFLFVGDVGRPDLLESTAGVVGSAEESARRLFESTRMVKELEEFVQIWPGHGAGSACGKALGALPSTTVGYELRANWALREQSEERFVRTVLAGQPEVPSYFGRMKRINRDGAEPIDLGAPVVRLDREQLERAVAAGAQAVDTRGAQAFANDHLIGALNIPDDGSFVTWAGWLLEPERPVVLIAPAVRVDALRRDLACVGVDGLSGYSDELSGWSQGRASGTPIELVYARDFDHERGGGGILIDVRSAEEFEAGHIPGARHIHLGRLREAAESIDRAERVVVYCEAGGRSAIAASLLRGMGMERVTNITDGYAAWRSLART